MNILVLLIVAHALADYPLQGDFLARAKNHRAPIAGVPWYQALMAHAVIQGGGVYLITGSLTLGLAETVAHAVIDYLKSDGRISFNFDQGAHIACKVLWALLMKANLP